MQIVLINVDQDGYEIEPVVIDLIDEDGNPTNLPENDFLVPPCDGGFYRPKWDFVNKTWTEGAPEQALQIAKKNKIAKFEYEKNELIGAGFEHNGDIFPFTESKDQPLFTAQLVFLLAFPDKVPPPWKTLNNGVKIFTRDEFFSICEAGERHLTENTAAFWKLEEYISKVESMDELNSLESFEASKSIVL
jgi:hypothetical protein